MKKFQFRLQRVLEYREHLEESAKSEFASARRAYIQGIQRIDALKADQRKAMLQPCPDFRVRLAVEGQLARMTHEERILQIQLNDFEMDQNRANQVYLERRSEAEALRKLREKAHATWSLEAERFEQAALDEWATQRRPK